ncbi:MAG: hypothetical protein IIA83_03365 [Thaumarchaeota archaeon]|nr:hypothetical protein [Nitrososphaerota archaeon]
MKERNTEQKKLVDKLNPSDLVEFNNLVEAYQKQDDDGVKQYVESQHSKEVENAVNYFNESSSKIKYIPDMLREMVLTYLITNFEVFLEQSYESLLLMRPELLNSDEKEISYSELLENIDNIKQHLAAKESKKFLKKNIDDIEKYFDKNLKLKLSNEAVWSEFRESIFRRHIITHNHSRPDDDYKKAVGYTGSDNRLATGDAYIIKAMQNHIQIAKVISNHLSIKFGQPFYERS